MAQNGTKTELTGKKLKVAEGLASPEFDGNISRLLEEYGVPRRSFYNWWSDDNYVQAVNNLIERHTDTELGRVWQTLSISFIFCVPKKG